MRKYTWFHFFSKILTKTILIALLFQCQQPSDIGETLSQISQVSPLETYVKSVDPVTDYELVHESKGEGYSYYVIRSVSQNWLSANEVTETTWWH